jgi:hypothetical protein
MKGELLFTPEELEEEKKEKEARYKSFFQDGVPVMVVVLKKEKIEDVGKTSGKPYTRTEWTLVDNNTGDKKVLMYDFNFTDAMEEHKPIMRCQTSLFRVTPRLEGTNAKGFDTFDYEIEYMGESGAAPILADDEVSAAVHAKMENKSEVEIPDFLKG